MILFEGSRKYARGFVRRFNLKILKSTPRHYVLQSFLHASGNMVELANFGEDIALAILICCDVLSILRMGQVCT